jgi:hypothetical protein
MQPSPLRLSDSELDAVFAAARPLAPHLRDEFLQAVADALAGLRELGPGATYRVIRDQQRRFFDPPDFVGPGVRRGGHGL